MILPVGASSFKEAMKIGLEVYHHLKIFFLISYKGSRIYWKKTVNQLKCSLYFVYLGLAIMALAFMEGYCWSKTSERQVLIIRFKYLEVVLRQEVGFFNSQEATTSNIINNISKDTSLFQELINEKFNQIRISIFEMTHHLVLFIASLGNAKAYLLTWPKKKDVTEVHTKKGHQLQKEKTSFEEVPEPPITTTLMDSIFDDDSLYFPVSIPEKCCLWSRSFTSRRGIIKQQTCLIFSS